MEHLNIPSHSHQMRRLHETCPMLMDNLLPSSERHDIVEQSVLAPLADKMHLRPNATRCISRLFIRNQLDLPLNAKELNEDHYFTQQLREAFRVDYNMPHIASLGTQPIQWFSQFSFTDPLTRHRVTFTAYGNAVCRFDVGFVHERTPGEAKLFALITELEDCGEDDPVLQLPRMRLMSQSQRIIGLPVIGSKPVYVVDMDPTHDQAAAPFRKWPLRLSSTSREDEELSSVSLLQCWWEVGIM
ncbi:hypothetical protein VC83_09247 [Pseudogymnoascus destructans]|uniref:Uncharacterized protein n=2 Tax=Pseudogymnoascus destructans TaxID=655981 RepID=L8FU79_PSED2|nr:uncharacterized protein VC83_09247 [Pseudogymnoascus destructans]ELR04028.1 hypothetical protein GMDG_06539 [Pseudogymnoascus destructans 20631-21]OAF54518.1 hypothetical protein VC83_09247 [Pseudogymnoascus destructans]